MQELITDPVLGPIMKRRLELPKNLPEGIEHIDAFILRNLTYVPVLLTEVERSTDVTPVELLADMISPVKTLQRQGGDCKSFATLYVAYQRLTGKPVRFYAPEPNHVMVEVYDEKSRKWYRHSPMITMPINGPLSEDRPDYDKAYETVLEMLRKDS